MTGWRLGWLVGRADLGRKAGPLNEFVVSHATSFIQKAGEIALADGEPWVREQSRSFARTATSASPSLRAMPGVTVPDPDGAFYLFPRIDGLTDSIDFCRRLLVEHAWASPPAPRSVPAARARSGSATRRIPASSKRR